MKMQITILLMVLCSVCVVSGAKGGPVYPGETWERRSPDTVRLDAHKLAVMSDYAGGMGCVVRHGYLVYEWGDASRRMDVASAVKPFYTFFLFKALQDKRISSLDEPVCQWEPRLKQINPLLDHKDARITWRHMANQISCYGLVEAPGTAFDYNDWQMALLFDTLFGKVYHTDLDHVDDLLHTKLTDVIQCQDNPTFLAFGKRDRAGRMAISPRDFARLGLLYLRQGRWKDKPLLASDLVHMSVTSPVPNSIPRAANKAADMIPGQRSIGSRVIPDNQTDHMGSYSWLWWINGVDREGKRHWPDVPVNAYGCFGHGGLRAMVVLPDQDLIVSWNETHIEGRDMENKMLKALIDAVQPESQTLAFPGAEGFGRFAQGGRGGDVVHVTHLNDAGPGSLREAVSQSHRTVVFDVGGIIPLKSRLVVKDHITLAGQTAPGEGITIYGNGVSFTDAHHTIARYLRVRMGVNGDRGKDAVSLARGHDMIFDHLSVSWGRDENFSANGDVRHVTIQNCLIAQGLHPHSCGGLIQTSGGISLLRNLYIDNHTRNVKAKGVNQYINNVVYNWRVAAYILGDSAGDSYANVINNCFINGPDTKSAAFTRGNMNFHLYAQGNWQDVNQNGLWDGDILSRKDYGVVDWVEIPHVQPSVTVLTPEQAYDYVKRQAGASLHRDSVDQRLIRELISLGKSGQILSNENDAPMHGPGRIVSGTPVADTDQDGMPDTWEQEHGLDIHRPDHNGDANGDGFTNLEDYLNSLVP